MRTIPFFLLLITPYFLSGQTDQKEPPKGASKLEILTDGDAFAVVAQLLQANGFDISKKDQALGELTTASRQHESGEFYYRLKFLFKKDTIVVSGEYEITGYEPEPIRNDEPADGPAALAFGQMLAFSKKIPAREIRFL